MIITAVDSKETSQIIPTIIYIYVKLIGFLGTGGAECNVGLQKCYVDAGIDTTGGSNSQLTWYLMM